MKPWQFNREIAANFVNHAEQHIPNYHQVIDQCVDVCDSYKDDLIKIIDVGCATGETIRRLHHHGFKNLHGVDNSQDMLELCPDIATYFCSDTFPDENFDVVLANWTLHFVKDKLSYLQSIYDHLNKNGTLILSDKVSKDPRAIKFYHDLKRKNGVTDQGIEKKAIQVKDVMFLESVEWYLDTLKSLGFSQNNIHITNAHWCFATIVAFKDI
jgi:tRNA (cmo5U34)-methyltransferase